MIDGVDLSALEQWMDRQGLGEGPIAEATTLAGGTQNILLRFSRSGRSYVLRRPPPVLRANSNETMRREARVLAALKGSNVPHPELIAACPLATATASVPPSSEASRCSATAFVGLPCRE